MSYLVIDLKAASDLLAKFVAGESYDSQSVVRQEGVDDVETADIDLCALAKDLEKLLDTKPPKNASRSPGAWFDMKAVAKIHGSLRNLSAEAASDPRFWAWLTFAGCGKKYAEIVSKRFKGKRGEGAKEKNFAITTQADVFEGLFAHIWWRGHRFYDPAAANPYDLAERGYVDLWRSHILREAYSYGPNMGRAFIKFMYPRHGEVSGHHAGYMRALPPKLKARHTSCCFEVLSEEECSAIIKELAAEAAAEGFPDKKAKIEKPAGRSAKKRKKSRRKK
jgi:hypothetical protein